MDIVRKLHLNVAAVKIADACGFNISGRDVKEFESGGFEIVWHAVTGETVELVCQPHLEGGKGWAGWVAVISNTEVLLRSALLVLPSENLQGQEAGMATGERVRTWADRLVNEPGLGLVSSPVTPILSLAA